MSEEHIIMYYNNDYDCVVSELKVCKRMLNLAESRLLDNEYRVGPDKHQQLIDFKEMLEKTERELFELKTHMKTKVCTTIICSLVLSIQ